MLKTNKDQLVKIAIQGQASHSVEWAPFEIAHDGLLHPVPSTGGITLNVQVGDKACGWRGDHVEPGVSTVCVSQEKRAQNGYNYLACAGNKVRILTGESKGKTGTVIGTHGGVEHVMIDFPQDVLETLTFDDKFMIESYGQGLTLTDFPDIKTFNIDPEFLEKLNVKIDDNQQLIVPVTTIVPAHLMGSGIGALGVMRGDYDILTQDAEMNQKYGLDKLRLGDFVAITDADNSYGRTWRSGAISIGLVIHCDSYLAGHGPGVMTIFSSATGKIAPSVDANANMANILKIGKF